MSRVHFICLAAGIKERVDVRRPSVHRTVGGEGQSQQRPWERRGRGAELDQPTTLYPKHGERGKWQRPLKRIKKAFSKSISVDTIGRHRKFREENIFVKGEAETFSLGEAKSDFTMRPLSRCFLEADMGHVAKTPQRGWDSDMSFIAIETKALFKLHWRWLLSLQQSDGSANQSLYLKIKTSVFIQRKVFRSSSMSIT